MGSHPYSGRTDKQVQHRHPWLWQCGESRGGTAKKQLEHSASFCAFHASRLTCLQNLQRSCTLQTDILSQRQDTFQLHLSPLDWQMGRLCPQRLDNRVWLRRMLPTLDTKERKNWTVSFLVASYAYKRDNGELWVYLRIGSCLACVYRATDARGKFGEQERSVRVARGAAESNSSFLSALQTSQVHPWLDIGTAKSMNQFFYNMATTTWALNK